MISIFTRAQPYFTPITCLILKRTAAKFAALRGDVFKSPGWLNNLVGGPIFSLYMHLGLSFLSVMITVYSHA